MDKEQRIEEIAKWLFGFKFSGEMAPWESQSEEAKQGFRDYAHYISKFFPQVPQGDDEGLLKDEDWTPGHQVIAEAKEYCKAQRDLTTRLIKQERLDRPESRELMGLLISAFVGDSWQDMTPEMRDDYEALFDQILALIPDEEEMRKQLEVLRVEIADLNKKLDDREVDLLEAKREERERIIGWLDKRLSIHVMSKDGLSGWRWGLTDEDWQAVKEGCGGK